MDNSYALSPNIITLFNYIDWRGNIYICLCNKGLYRMKLDREVEPQQYIEKSKFLNKLYEAFGFMCIHISRELLFHLEGIRTLKEVWDKLECLFGK